MPEVFFDEKGARLDNKGFHAVIGNPPYLRTERLDRQQLSYFRGVLSGGGQTDLYLMFIHRAMRLVRAGGYFAFITPRFLCFNLDAEPTRRQIMQTTLFKLVDAGRPFVGVNTECVVTALCNSSPHNNNTDVETLDSGGKPVLTNTVSQASFWELPNIIFNLSLTPVEMQVIKRILTETSPLSSALSIKRGMEIGKQAVRVASEGVDTLLGEEVHRYSLAFGDTLVSRDNPEVERGACQRL